MKTSLFNHYPLADSEILLAKGEYQYWCNEQRMDIQEPWFIHQLGEQIRVRSERLASEANVCIQVFAILSQTPGRQGLADDFEVKLIDLQSGAVRVSASYRLYGDYAVVSRSQFAITGACDLPSPLQQTYRVGAEEPDQLLAAFPLLRIFMGGAVNFLRRQGGVGQLLIPDIIDPAATERLLLPLISERSATPIEPQRKFDQSARWSQLLAFDYCGDQYSPGSHFYFSREGFLLNYFWRRGDGDLASPQHWDVRLEHFSGALSALGIDLADDHQPLNNRKQA